MEKIMGKVIEVFIPNDNKDVMLSNKIGFKIKTINEEVTVIYEQNEINTNIFKDDNVYLIKTFINNQVFLDIELCEDNTDE